MGPAWAEPPVSRAGLAYRQAYLAQQTPDVALELIEKAVGHADKALDDTLRGVKHEVGFGAILDTLGVAQ